MKRSERSADNAPVSLPRHITRGSVYLLTRRCSERRFFLTPDSFITSAFLYLLAVASARFGVNVVIVVAMGNHYHAVVEDVTRQLPNFAHLLHSLSARCFNAYRGRWEAFWSPGSYNAVRLVTREDVVRKVVYCVLNPVRARLVRTPGAYPGAITPPRMLIEAPRTYHRPNRFFSPTGTMPAVATLVLSKPRMFDDMSDEAFAAMLETRIAEALEVLWAEHRRAKLGYLGPRKIRAIKWSSSPRNSSPRRTLNPHIACCDELLRIAEIEQRQRFLAAYASALERWCDGDRTCVFPAGTWWMDVFHGAACSPGA